MTTRTEPGPDATPPGSAPSAACGTLRQGDTSNVTPGEVLGLFAGRVTYVIDREGVVRDVFESQLRFLEHVRRALELVKRLER